MLPLSILDLSPIVQGGTAGQALQNSRDLARHAETWGYHRYWLAEHHNMPGIASAATAVAIGYVGSGTQRIRIGAGGVMLPNHPLLSSLSSAALWSRFFPAGSTWGRGGRLAPIRSLPRRCAGPAATSTTPIPGTCSNCSAISSPPRRIRRSGPCLALGSMGPSGCWDRASTAHGWRRSWGCRLPSLPTSLRITWMTFGLWVRAKAGRGPTPRGPAFFLRRSSFPSE